MTSVSGVSYTRRWAQKEDLWSANAVEGYWYARPSMISAAEQTPSTGPHAASIVGVLRMPLFVQIATAARRKFWGARAGGVGRAMLNVSRFPRKHMHRSDKHSLLQRMHLEGAETMLGNKEEAR